MHTLGKATAPTAGAETTISVPLERSVHTPDTKLPASTDFAATTQISTTDTTQSTTQKQPHQSGPAAQGKRSPPPKLPTSGKELKRARIIITVKRTPEYAQWLIDNPTGAGNGDDEIEPGSPSITRKNPASK
mmetsp:Transcript_20423/g.29962  ORF Transcript_20423/g.29962 Transcript_20423/m.29962 type:complete len:132 (-) Transcript_20423:431-826(-)